MGPTEVAVGGSGEEGGGEGGGGDGGGERRGGERHDHDIDRAQSARLGADQRDARLRPGWDRPGDALAGAGRRDTGEVSASRATWAARSGRCICSYVSRQLAGSMARSAAVALHRAAGSSQRPTAWATPGVVSPVVPPKACREHGWQGWSKSAHGASRRRAMQGWCRAHAHGLAPSVARARQRVKGEAAPSSRRRDLRHKACSVRELRRARMRGWCRKEGGRAPARRRDHWTATAPSLQRCPFERRRDDDPCAVVRDARELPLGEDDGRHPLVTVYSFNT